ncbi:hypothetical protein, partial [Mesorhizobium japonicum]|uniref:hypothetical protein n=1 Tax=Mesorhizobium japonicum TaxID=2066070 RepID=UPI003B5C9293
MLILTGDPIGPRLASHGIRVWNMAVELSGAHDVRLLTTSRAERTDPRFEVAAVAAGDSAAFAPLEAWADVIIVHGAGYIAFPALRRTSTPLVADAYGPMVLEHLEFDRHLPPEQAEPEVAHSAWIVNELLTRADYVLVASERQRLYVLGCLSALGRINPLTYGDDATLGELVGIVPFGLSPEPPRHDRPALRGVVPGIGADDTVLIWSGGIYNWFDPETLIRAVAEVAARHDDIRLFFLGTVHPSPEVPEMPVITASRRLAAELGVAGRH